MPNIIWKDEKYILFSCKNCLLIEKEKIEDINNNISEFLKKGEEDICQKIEIDDFERFLEEIMKTELDKYIFLKKFMIHFNRYKIENYNKLSLKFIDNVKSNIYNIIINNMTTKVNLLLLYYRIYYSSLYYSLKDINVIIEEKKISSKIKKILQEDYKNFEALINNEKEKVLAYSNNLNQEEINFLKEYIEYIFNPKKDNTSNLDKKRIFFEKAILFSTILKKYILINKINGKIHCINIDKTIKDINKYSKNLNSIEDGNFILSLIGKIIEEKDNTIYITKNKDEQFIDIELASFQTFICLRNYIKYELHFDFGEEKNEKILKQKNEQKKFLDDMKKKISDFLKIDINRLIFTNVSHGCIKSDLIIIDEKEEEKKLIEEIPINLGVTKINKKKIFDTIILNNEILDSRYDRESGWGENEKRGGEKYIPPLKKWKGFGINVINKYDNGNNIWLDYHNKDGEYSIAYLGISNLKNEIENLVYFDEDPQSVEKIFNDKLLENEIDLRNENSKCGQGICVFQDPVFAEKNAGFLEINGYFLLIMFMIRVNPENIRQPKNNRKYWILDPTPQNVRPYRILIKKLENPKFQYKDVIVTSSIINKDFLKVIDNSKDETFENLMNDSKLKGYSQINGEKVNIYIFALRLYSSYYFHFINYYLREKKVLQEKKR